MKALLRFRPVREADGQMVQLAWYEPAHHILEAVAPWFAKRSPEPRWAIFTSERPVEWDGRQLHYAPGLPRAHAPVAEDSDEVWLRCYQRVFRLPENGAVAPQDPAGQS
jgi:probable DNA metabolism protein